jgi:hypothetical protein
VGGAGGFLRTDAEPAPRRLEPGDVVMLPYGDAHQIADDVDSPLTQSVHLCYDAQREFSVFPLGGDEPQMAMLCGAFRLERSGGDPLLRLLLPRVEQSIDRRA